MKIQTVSLLHTHYDLINHLNFLTPYFGDVLFIDNTPANQRQAIETHSIFVPKKAASSYGKALYEYGQIVDMTNDYILWCNQDIFPAKDFDKHMQAMLTILDKKNPGILSCGVTGSVMAKYCNKDLATIMDMDLRYKLKHSNGDPAYNLLETIFLFIKPSLLKAWGEKIQTLSVGFDTEAFLVAECFAANRDALVYTEHVVSHMRELTRQDKGSWTVNTEDKVCNNLIYFLHTYGKDTTSLIRVFEKTQNRFLVLFNETMAVLQELEKKENN